MSITLAAPPPSTVSAEQTWTVTLMLDHANPTGPAGTCAIDGRTFEYTLLAEPTRFVLVELDPDEAEALSVPLEQVRAVASARAGWAITENQPKLGVVAPTRGRRGLLRFRVRENPARWHRGMSGSGMLVLASAATLRGSVVQRLLPREASAHRQIRALTPAGERVVHVEERPTGVWATYALSAVSVVAEIGT